MGLVAALHFLAALPAYPHADNVPFPPLLEYDVGDNPLLGAIFTEPPRYADGFLAVPDGPGLGVTLDTSRLQHFAT